MPLIYFALSYGSANYGLWVKPGLPSVFVNKVLLEYSYVYYLLSMSAFMPWWQSWVIVTETLWLREPKNLVFGPLYNEFVNLCTKHVM